MPRQEKRLPPEALGLHQVEAVISIPDISDSLGQRDRAILELFYSAGLRRSELAKLEINDLNRERRTLQICLSFAVGERIFLLEAMARNLTAPASSSSEMRQKSRVWDFSPIRRFQPLGNRRRLPDPRRKPCTTLTIFTSGIPQWPSRDPIGERGGWNLYRFVFNSPLGWLDYLGREPRNIEIDFKFNDSVTPEYQKHAMAVMKQQIAGLNVLLKQCCDQFEINCDTYAIFDPGIFKKKKSTGSNPSENGYNTDKDQAHKGAMISDIGEMTKGRAIPVLLTNGDRGGQLNNGTSAGVGMEDVGAALDIAKIKPDLPRHADILAHELGHAVGYEVEDPKEWSPKEQGGRIHKKDPGKNIPYNDRPLMSVQGGGTVDECWCRRMSKYSVPLPQIIIR